MSSCLESINLLGLAMSQLPSSWTELVQEWLGALSTPVSLIIFGAGLFGLLVGFLVGKGSEYTDPVDTESGGGAELQWRHEKLVLLERQRAEEQLRRDRYAAAVSSKGGERDGAIKSRYFALAEILREERQKTGGDLSRFELLDERLAAIASQSGPRPEAIAGCREIASSRIEQLKQSRDVLRSAGACYFEVESEVLISGELSGDTRGKLAATVDETGALLSPLPTAMHTDVSEADRQIREILAAGGEPEFDAMRNILLIDGAETASLEMDEKRVPDAVEALETALESRTDEESEREDDTAKVPYCGVPEPDGAFVSPSSPAPEMQSNGFHDLTRESVAEPLPESESEAAVIFRSNNAELWGQDVYRGANSRARALSNLPKWAKWISIARLDTGERVFAPANSASLTSGEGGTAFGFNGTNELFYGARHLGIFAESCPNEVETRFTYGGWGFGHRVKGADSENQELQASGWEGREIDADTVFEISIHADLPELKESDKVLDTH